MIPASSPTFTGSPGVARSPGAAVTGTVTSTGSGLAWVGLLDGRGLADTLWVNGPGHHLSGLEETVETWNVGGREATNRAGAAEHLGLSRNTVNQYASPSGRSASGWPEPLPERADGHEVFALTELDAFAQARASAQPAPAAIAVGDDPDRLIGVDEFAALRGVKRDTFKRYVEDSLNAWATDQDGYLPRPDVPPTPSRRGFTYEWRLAAALAWTAPPARRTGGRIAGPAPQRTDLQAVLAGFGDTAGERPTVRELAAALTERMGRTVSSQTVRRLLRDPVDESTTK